MRNGIENSFGFVDATSVGEQLIRVVPQGVSFRSQIPSDSPDLGSDGKTSRYHNFDQTQLRPQEAEPDSAIPRPTLPRGDQERGRRRRGEAGKGPR